MIRIKNAPFFGLDIDMDKHASYGQIEDAMHRAGFADVGIAHRETSRHTTTFHVSGRIPDETGKGHVYDAAWILDAYLRFVAALDEATS